MDNAAIGKLVRAHCESADTDLYLFSGEITRESGAEFVQLVCGRATRRTKATVFLTTNGGDPNAAYRMAKSLRRAYSTVRLLVVGPCKSAGTLIALGANELGFAPAGELGPLDVQLTKPDEIFVLGSGLDVLQALSMITDAAFERFEQFMINLGARSGGAISTKMAAEVASNFASKLFEPISAQIDPLRLGEVQRAIRIARTYGERLSDGLKNIKPNTIDHLIEGYPSHGFVIDMEEAQKLFVNVTELTAGEAALSQEFQGALRDPLSNPMATNLEDLFPPPPSTSDGTQNDDQGDAADIGPVNESQQGEQRPPSGNGTSAAAQHSEESSEVGFSR